MTDWSKIANELSLSGQADAKLGFGEGLAKSFGWSFPGMIGVHPPADVQEWQAEHPIAALGAEVAGWAVPLGGWIKASRGIPKLAAAMDAVSARAAAAPVSSALKREIVRFAPFELGRFGLGVTAAPAIADELGTGHDTPIEIGMKAGTDLALAGVAAGAFEFIKGAGAKAISKIRKHPGADLNAPPQIQIRQIRQAISKEAVTPEGMTDAQTALVELSRQVRHGTPKDGIYVKNAVHGDRQQINRLFKPSDSPSLERRLLSPRKKQLGDEYFDVLARSGFFEGFEGYVQHPRFLRAKEKNAAQRVQTTLRKLQSIDKGMFWTRDGNDGLYILAKKIKGETKAKPGDEWLIWKTDQPDAFAPSRKAWRDGVVPSSALYSTRTTKLAETGVAAADEVVKLRDGLPLMDFRGLMQHRGRIAELAKALMNKSGLTGADGGELARRAGLFAKQYLSPAMHQFSHSPRAARLHAIIRRSFDRAEAVARERFAGKGAIGEKSLYRDIVQGTGKASGETIDRLIDDMFGSAEEVVRFARAVNAEASLEDAAKVYGVGEKGMALLKKLDEVDKLQIGDIAKVESAIFGKTKFRPIENHYMVSHTWEGTWRVPIYNETNHLVGVGGGKTRKSAINAANEIVEDARLSGKKWRADDAMEYDFKTDQELLRQLPRKQDDYKLFKQLRDEQILRTYMPGRMTNIRHGTKGYKEVWTKSELKDLIFNNMRQTQNYIADVSVKNGLADDLAQLALEDPSTALQLARRMQQLTGKQGEFAQWQNRVVDQVMAPVLGKNSANKIVGTANSVMFHLTLGFFNTSYALANVLTFVQTSLPHIAWLAHAAPDRVARYYTWWPVNGEKVVDGLGTFDIFKLAGRSFKEMGNPDAVLRKHFEQAGHEGVWDPRFVEEYVGQNAKRVVALKDTLSGKEPFSAWLSNVSELLPGASEKFARGHSFVLGHITGRDVFGFRGDELYRFAKDFTEKTQFLYSSADRANVITGPFGSSLGLFKNWVMHYIAWMMEYTGEGVMRGNWNPLLWMVGGTTAIGGVGALPAYGAIDSLSKWMSDKTMMQHIYGMFGGTGDHPYPADAVFYGLPALFGISVQNQVAAPFADPGQDAARLFSFAYVDRMKAAARAAGAAIDAWGATGRHPVADQTVRDGLMRAFAPKALYRYASLAEEGVIRSLNTGYPMVSGLSPIQQMLYASGLNPRKVEIAYRVNQELWEDQNKMRERIQSYGEAWAEARMAGDFETVRAVMARALAEGVDLSSVIRSAKTRLAKGREDMISRAFTPQAIYEYRKLGLYN